MFRLCLSIVYAHFIYFIIILIITPRPYLADGVLL